MACSFGFCNRLFWHVLLVSANGCFGMSFWFLLPVVLACSNDPAARACCACLSSLFRSNEQNSRNNSNQGNNLRRHGGRGKNDQSESTDPEQHSSKPSPPQQWAPLPYPTTLWVPSQQPIRSSHMSQQGVILGSRPAHSQTQLKALYAGTPSSQFGSTMSLTQPDDTWYMDTCATSDQDIEHKCKKMNHTYKKPKQQLQLWWQQRWWRRRRRQQRLWRQQHSQSVRPITTQEPPTHIVNLIGDCGTPGNYSANSGSNFHKDADTQSNGNANLQMHVSHQGDICIGNIGIDFDNQSNGRQEPPINIVNIISDYGRSGNYSADSGSKFHQGDNTHQSSGHANLQMCASRQGDIRIGNVSISFNNYANGRQAM